MKNPNKHPNRPKTLSERRAELEFSRGEIVCDAMLHGNQMLFAAERLFSFSWGDDGWDPLRQEIVALYASREDFEVACALNDIPESSNTNPCESSKVGVREIPYESAGVDGSVNTVFVVFKTRYQRLLQYDSEEYNNLLTYRTDGSGAPLRAFADRTAADVCIEEETRTMIAENTWESLTGYGNTFGEFTSLELEPFWLAVGNLGVSIASEDLVEGEPTIGSLDRYVFPQFHPSSRSQPAHASAAMMDLALNLLKLLDRVALFKTVTMKVHRFHRLS